MSLTDTSKILAEGMSIALAEWAERYGGASSGLYWLLKLQIADVDPGADPVVPGQVPTSLRDRVERSRRQAEEYFADVRYSTLEPVTKVWGTVVNGLRVAANSDRATEIQKKVFDFPADELVGFFQGARFRMEVADQLYHLYKAMPAPECQALAALLNVHVSAPLDTATMVRLVRLLDHEGPMSPAEAADLHSLANTSLVHAAFAGLRREV